MIDFVMKYSLLPNPSWMGDPMDKYLSTNDNSEFLFRIQNQRTSIPSEKLAPNDIRVADNSGRA